MRAYQSGECICRVEANIAVVNGDEESKSTFEGRICRDEMKSNRVHHIKE